MVEAIKEVAGRLGNTPAICRKCYIHPHIMEAYLDGTLAEGLKSSNGSGLPSEEAAVLRLLRRQPAEASQTHK